MKKLVLIIGFLGLTIVQATAQIEKEITRKEIIDLVKKDGSKLATLSTTDREDPEIMAMASVNFPDAFLLASKRLRNDREFVMELLRQNGLIIKNVPNKFLTLIFCHIDFRNIGPGQILGNVFWLKFSFPLNVGGLDFRNIGPDLTKPQYCLACCLN